MPLKLDCQERGVTSVHVAPHPKLKEHRTVIREAWQLMSQLADDRRVIKINFGRVCVRPADSGPRIDYYCNDQIVRLLLVGNFAAQIIELQLDVKTATAPELLIALLEQRWNEVLVAKDDYDPNGWLSTFM